MHDDEAQDLCDWMTSWNDDSRQVELPQLCRAIAMEFDFWSDFADLVAKFLSKRSVGQNMPEPRV
jgi:hypothetical protein